MTKRNEHTPGPWEVCKDAVNVWIGDDCFEIAHVTPHRPDEECEANARLIAAAPELLEAAEAMLASFVASGEGDIRECRAARAAISQARGDE